MAKRIIHKIGGHMVSEMLTTAASSEITRRGFIKGAAAASALVAAGTSVGCAPQQENGQVDTNQPPEEQIFVNSCHGNCGRNCAWDVTVRDGYIVNCAPHEYDDDPDGMHRGGCWKGFLNINRVYDQNRLKYPMKRVNSKDEEPQWEQISWDEAIDLLASEWKRIADEVGPEGFALNHVYGSSTMLSGNGGGCWGKLISATGADTVLTGADMATIQAMGLDSAVCGAAPDSLRDSETIVFWGVNAAETKWVVWRHACEARRNHGCKIITIDPNVTITAAHSDQHITIKPATDGALIMSVLQQAFENGWADEDFLRDRTCAPYLVKEDGTLLRAIDLGEEAPTDGSASPIYVWDETAGEAVPVKTESDSASFALSGTHEVGGFKVRTALDLLKDRVAPYTPERTEEITGVPADVIRELTSELATTKSAIVKDNGYAHYANSFHTALGMDTIMMVMGNLGKTGCGIYYWYEGGPTNAEWGVAGTAGPSIPDSQLPNVMETGKLGGKELPLKGMLTYAGNVLGSTADRIAMENALKKLEFLCVVEIRMTDTCKYADLLLPACHWWERNDVLNSGLLTPYMRIDEKATEPQFESLSDWDICQKIAEKLGVGDYFQGSDLDQLAAMLDTEQNQAMGCTFADLQEKKAVRIVEDGQLCPADGSFATENGRVNFFIDRPTPYGNWDVTLNPQDFNLPDFVENAEVLESHPLAQKYPLIFMTPHTKYGTQTTFHHTEFLHELLPEPEIHVNPADAEKRGVADGEYMRLFNDRSEVVARAKFDQGIMPGVLVMYHGWAEEYFKKGHYQRLSSFDNTDLCSNNAAYFDVRVEAEPYEEE